ncbi:LysM peptidoglycan-binding domain-containing protein [Methylobacter sp. YRD-M1]|uniref:LysM peptidoglycan-binding domain-containing protein n=1 Tax=Methylobacter sp. YRD-M1 TaxID=2911520 RepID=UPI002DD6A7BE|nr:LysM peptidoglycan-binding domain-containing protein [Methylobacter sp. YRD-M1]
MSQKPPLVGQEDSNYVYHHHTPLSKKRFKSSLNSRSSVWDRLLSLYALPEIENERIDRELNWYLQHPDYIARVQERAEPYMHLILNEIEAKDLPGELALLPIVESAFLPEAYSKSDASGLWQFIPATGRLFGLKQDSWYDGRRDVYASTKAATTFLKQLNETFDGDWLLALASYNYGKGNVRKAIERNEDLSLPTDYWSLNLPEETTNYVPRLLAIAKLFAHADKYHIPLQYIPNKPYFEVVDIKSQLDLDKAAQLANTPLKEFLKLNPGFNRWTTAPEGPHRLLVPIDQAQSFKRNLAMLPDEDRVAQRRYYEERVPHVPHDEQVAQVAYNRHKVRSGETLTSIAARNHTTAKAIRQANHLAGNTIHSGMILKVPSSGKSANFPIIAKASKHQFQNNRTYTVKKGDTFWKIGQNFSVSGKDIASWNKLTLASSLAPGQKLIIKGGEQQLVTSSSAESNPFRLIHYTVKPGDSLMKITRKFNVSLTDLRKWNSDTIGKALRPGQKIKILVDNSQPAT